MNSVRLFARTLTRTSLQRIFVALICTVLSLSAARAQTPLDLPDGEPIVSICTYSAPADIRITATKTTVYIATLTNKVWSHNENIYTAPFGRRIVDAAMRADEATALRSYVALLDDGTIVQLSINAQTLSLDGTPTIITSPANPQTNLQNGQVPEYKKILWDSDLIVQLGTVLYSRAIVASSWRLDSVGLGKAFVQDVQSDNAGNILAATGLGLFRRARGQSMWARLSGYENQSGANLVYVTRNAQRIYVATTTAIFSSDNNGLSFTPDSAGLQQAVILRFAEDANGVVYAVGNLTDRSSQLFRRAVGAKAWKRFDASFNTATQSTLRVFDIAGEHSLECATAAGCFSSTDTGDSWLYSTSGIQAEDVYAMQLFPNSVRVVSTAVAIYRKQGNWSKVFPTTGFSGARPLLRSGGATPTLITQLGVNQNNPAAQADIYVSHDQGQTWTLDTNGLSAVPAGSGFGGSVLECDRNGKQYVITQGTQGVPLHVYSQPWSMDTNGLELPEGQAGTQFGIGLFSDIHNTMYLSGGVFTTFQFILQRSFFYRRSAGSTQWQADTNGFNGLPVSALTSNEQDVVVGTIVGYNGSSSLYRRNGNAWQSIPVPASAVSDISQLCFDSTKTLWASVGSLLNNNGFQRGVYATTDMGQHWDYAGLDGYVVRQVVANKEAVYAVTNHGVFELTRQPYRPSVAQFNKHQIDFGTVQLGQSRDTTVLLSNTGNDTLRIAFVRTNSQNFAVSPANFNVAPGASQAVTIHFEPVQSGQLSARAQTVGSTLPDTIALTGSGRAADAHIVLLSKFVIFGIVDIGTTKDTVVQIRNQGSEDLIISSIQSSNPVFSADPVPLTIAPGASSDLNLHYSPKTKDNVNGVIKLIANTLPDSIRVLGVGNIVSVEDEDSDKAKSLGYSIQPNPTTLDKAMIRLELRNSGKLSIRVSDERGLDLGQRFETSVEAGTFELPLSTLVTEPTTGVVLVHVRSAQGVGTIKCILQ